MTIKEMGILESRTINICIIFVFIMAASGVIFGFLADSSAILLDGIFSCALLITVFFSKIVQKITTKPATYAYPTGFNRLESLYILFKILTLIAILSLSLLHSMEIIFHYYYHGVSPGSINVFYAQLYFIIKITAFICAYIIYSRAIKKTEGQSELLKVELKSTLIDGGMTIGIMLGFIIIPMIGLPKELADSIVLLFLSIFLLIIMYKDFKNVIRVIINKRFYEIEEQKFIVQFEEDLHHIEINDLFIIKSSKQTFANIKINFKVPLSIEELKQAEEVMLNIMKEDFSDITILFTFSDQIYEAEENL